MAKTAFLFPGQGSQYVGMGRDFAQTHAWARDIFALADQTTGLPISSLCLEGPMEDLTRTANLQPAVTAVNLMAYQALVDLGLTPDFVAGHSLGEYAALAAAGVISAEETLRLVMRRGALMHRDALARPGAMQAIIGLNVDEVEAIAELARDRGEVVVANHNTPQQVVISGESQAVAAAAVLAKTKKAKTMPLPVSGAWHSPLMAAAAADFAADLEKVAFRPARFPVVLNVTATAETDPDRLKEAMIRQIISPVRWCPLVATMLDFGVTTFVEVGPKNVLTGLVKKSIPAGTDAKIINVENPDGAAQAAATIGS